MSLVSTIGFRLSLMLMLAGSGTIANGAQAATLDSKLTVSFLGVPVGKLKSSVKIDGSKYRVAGNIKTNSVVSIVSNTSANFASAGSFIDGRAVPGSHSIKYKSNKKRGDLSMSFGSGRVIKVSATPKIKYKEGAIPVTETHLKRVLDPVSSLVFPVAESGINDGKSVCNRTLPIFDGKSRINLVFSYKSSGKGKAKGFSGTVFNCAVRYQPVAGIRPNKKNIKFMKANRDMQVTMARVGETNVYALYGFRVRTDKGMASGKAYKFAVK